MFVIPVERLVIVIAALLTQNSSNNQGKVWKSQAKWRRHYQKTYNSESLVIVQYGTSYSGMINLLCDHPDAFPLKFYSRNEGEDHD